MLATVLVCASVNNGAAATNRLFELATGPFLSPVSPSGIDDSSPASFNDRFDCQQNSLIRDFLASSANRALLPNPVNRAPSKPLTTTSLPRPRKHERVRIVPAASAILGVASMYNPTDPSDMDAGNEETASGERYDPNGWTAAIRTDLRNKFGGVRFGKNYQPAFALVQTSDKQAIVRINDVGPLRHGRIIDLNKRAMSYFDPTLERGLIGKIIVTPLVGQQWALGPLDDDGRLVSVAAGSTGRR